MAARLSPGIRCLTLAPAAVLEVWENQRPVSMTTYHVGLSQGPRTDDVIEVEAGTNVARCLRDLRVWAEKGDGMLLLSNEKMRALLKAAAATAPEVTRLLLEAPGVVFFDEAHNLRNDKTRLHGYLGSLRTSKRVLLTGKRSTSIYNMRFSPSAMGFSRAKNHATVHDARAGSRKINNMGPEPGNLLERKIIVW